MHPNDPLLTSGLSSAPADHCGFSGQNQHSYLRLKLALGLGLRRQVFLAVCDNWLLRDRLVSQLLLELGAETRAGHCPSLVTLELNLNRPDPLGQIQSWVTEHFPNLTSSPEERQKVLLPSFQILGIEKLIRQPASVQKQFLDSLQRVERLLTSFESNLLLWLPRPWLYTIQQSAPGFWNYRTAIFEFEADPTPVAIAPLIPTPEQLPIPRDQKHFVGEIDRLQPEIWGPGGPAEVESADEISAPLVEEASSSESSWDMGEQDLPPLHPDPPALADQAEDPVSQPLPALAIPVVPLVPGLPTEAPPAPVSVEVLEPPASVGPSPLVPPISEPITILPELEVPPLRIHAELDLTSLVLSTVGQATQGNGHSPQQDDCITALAGIEELHREKAPASSLAAAYQELGHLYRERIEQGDISEQTLMTAILAYEQTLTWLEPASPAGADVLNDLGNLHWLLSRHLRQQSAGLTHLEQAIAAYRAALGQTQPQNRPQTYAMVQNNLGAAYSDLALYREAAIALQHSIRAYELALQYRRLEDDPSRYAATQNNLGTAFWNLAQHDQPVLRLKQAIAAYYEALRYYSPDREPLLYAMIQNNLGTAFWNLAQHEKDDKTRKAREKYAHAVTGRLPDSLLLPTPADWLEQAIAAYRAALTYRTLEVAPAAYAASQNNLGTAYWHLANLDSTNRQERRDLLQQAITAYQAALSAVHYLQIANQNTAPTLTFDQHATHNNLGLAYYQVATHQPTPDAEATRLGYLESALQHHLQALQGWQNQPDFYATALSHVIQTMRTLYSDFGMKGQNLGLSKLPANLLSTVMQKL